MSLSLNEFLARVVADCVEGVDAPDILEYRRNCAGDETHAAPNLEPHEPKKEASAMSEAVFKSTPAGESHQVNTVHTEAD